LLEFDPVIVDLGLEINDESGDSPEGAFRLHLATGRGHVLETKLFGSPYQIWTPSAFVIHGKRPITTAQWQEGKVNEFDPER
jgi:hypothetical protein